MPNPLTAALSKRTIFIALWLTVSLVGLAFTIQPVGFTRIRYAILGALAVFVIGGTILAWPKRRLRFVILGTIALLAILFFSPGRPYEREALQRAVTDGLKRYDGTAYVWGGENGRGIDCSGLIRRGMIDGCFLEGIRTLNPALLRASFDLWLHDCSARALRDGYRDLTRPLGTAEAVNDIPLAGLAPGDIAVTRDGLHILAYLGDGVWTQAAPEVGQVARFAIPAKNDWFIQPVVILRWKLLGE